MEQQQGNPAQPQQEYDRGILQVNHSGKTPDRMKRDEWSEGGVATLLDAYEAKWVLRNRAKLKGNDWEEIAGHVCARNGGSRPWKTQSQCKNKIEALKKRYRSEATGLGGGGPSTWAFFERMDLLLRCPASTNGFGMMMHQHQQHHLVQETMIPQVETGDSEQILVKMVNPHQAGGEVLSRVPSIQAGGTENNHQLLHHRQQQQHHHHHHNQQQQLNANCQRHQLQPFAESSPEEEEDGDEEEDASNTLPQAQVVMKRKEELSPDSETSTPKSKIAHAMDGSGKTGAATAAAAAAAMVTTAAVAAKRRKNSSPGSEVADSIRTFADSILKLEQAKMQMFKDSERLRAEAEARRVEMELKRTEIIAKTQLEIVKLLSGKPLKRSKLVHNHANGILLDRNNNKNRNKNNSNNGKAASQSPSSMND